MPLYEYYCSDCRTKFDARRPMSKADAVIQCKNCESMQTSRTLSLFATVSSSGSDRVPQTMSSGFGGGCCGGACSCGH
jgi:putative FmdB family regulatory protein